MAEENAPEVPDEEMAPEDAANSVPSHESGQSAQSEDDFLDVDDIDGQRASDSELMNFIAEHSAESVQFVPSLDV